MNKLQLFEILCPADELRVFYQRDSDFVVVLMRDEGLVRNALINGIEHSDARAYSMLKAMNEVFQDYNFTIINVGSADRHTTSEAACAVIASLRELRNEHASSFITLTCYCLNGKTAVLVVDKKVPDPVGTDPLINFINEKTMQADQALQRMEATRKTFEDAINNGVLNQRLPDVNVIRKYESDMLHGEWVATNGQKETNGELVA